MEAFPDIKVILTIRDPTSWFHSMSKTLLPTLKLIQTDWVTRAFQFAMGQRVTVAMVTKLYHMFRPEGCQLSLSESSESGEGAMVEFFEKWTEEVKRNVPKEQLLVYKVIKE